MARRLDTTTAWIAATQIAGDAARLACSIVRADGDTTGVYADAARLAVADLEGQLAKIKKALSRLPAGGNV